jgi:hypothetical protein
MWAPGEAADAQWRGSIHEVSTGKRLFVTETREVADFIAACLAASPATRSE